MNSRTLLSLVVVVAVALVAESGVRTRCEAAEKTIVPDLARVAAASGTAGANWTLVNRRAEARTEGDKDFVRLVGGEGTGVAWLNDFEFADGTIEFDLRGKNIVQQSFVGVAFHGVDEKTYDAIYFRPFNFKADDPARRSRAVQYISHPGYTWQKLRGEHPGRYEKPVSPVPDPDGWFHARVVIAWPKVSVFVDGAAEPCLVVDQLSDRKRGRVGLWVDVSGGDFANLKITVPE